MIWCEKYKPKDSSEVIGQDENLIKLEGAIVNKKPVLLSGGTGIGKTSSVYAIANKLGYEVLEINASDVRNKEGINNIVGNALKQQSLFCKGKLILVDEIDGLSGMKDRGGISALTALLNNCKTSMVMTTNDAYNTKIKPVKKKCEVIEFNELKDFDILKFLQKILHFEKINYDAETLKNIAMNAGGDLRGAINDLQVLSADVEMLSKIEGISEREKKKVIFEILKNVFRSENVFDVLGCLMKTDVNIDEFLLWLDENLPKEYKGDDLIAAYEKMSRADVFNGRIKNQRWRLLLYRSNLMTCGVNVAKSSVNNSFVGYTRSGRILKIWINNMKGKWKKSIVGKMSLENHMSKKKFEKEVLPYMKIIGRNSSEDFGLEFEEVGWLKR